MKFTPQLIASTLLAHLFCLPSLQAEDLFHTPELKLIQKMTDAAIEGGSEESNQLVEHLEQMCESFPKNPIYLAYLGSAYTLKSRDTFPGPSKFSFLKNGLKTMDKAVKMDPKNPATRFIRAMNNFQLPAIINRRDNAREDFSILIKQIEDPEVRKTLDPETLQAIYYYAGLSFKQLDRKKEAIAAWEKGRLLQANEQLSQMILAALSKYGS
ncbi:MAG: hypothetical protein AAFY98_09975 [Verrucomicrobiota bacterium]